jgi:hypothetical protein
MQKMTRATVTNLKIWIAQLLVTEALVTYPPGGQHLIPIYERIFAPISLLTLVPIWALRHAQCAALLAIVPIDALFIWTMIFSVVRNHKIVGAVCLFVFNFLGVVFVAGQFF